VWKKNILFYYNFTIMSVPVHYHGYWLLDVAEKHQCHSSA